ncbi:hypothetical protein VH567_11245 [Sphingomonas sp. 4RDLI-65]|uniref:hypothetical protein n=1 Tax=Sphingomonas sp. 4RDLI-65 TaxID=3111641 RepID=UPI003C233BCB
MTHVTTTPEAITPFVVECAGKLSEEPPRYVEYVAYPRTMESMCFENVDRMIKLHGGKRIMGWLLWEWPGVMIDAEHHAVWKKADGTWEDVTPKQDGETRIVFVRDDVALYDNNRSQLNRKFAARGNTLAREYIALRQEAEKVWNKHRQTGVYAIPAADLEMLQFRDGKAQRKWNRLLARYGPQSA